MLLSLLTVTVMELIFIKVYLFVLFLRPKNILNEHYFLISVSEFGLLEITGDEYAVDDSCGLPPVDCGCGIR